VPPTPPDREIKGTFPRSILSGKMTLILVKKLKKGAFSQATLKEVVERDHGHVKQNGRV